MLGNPEMRRLFPLVSGLLLVLLLSLSLAACVQPARDLHEPALSIPENWGDPLHGKQQSGWPDPEWWKQLGSNELSELVEQGRAHNLDLAAALARVQQAESAAKIAGAPLLPEVDLRVNTRRDLSPGDTASSTHANLSVGYEVDFWGKLRANQMAAEATLLANRFDRETVALTVTTGIVSTWLQVLSLRDQIVIAKEHIENAERVLALVEAQQRAGSASTLDLARQRAALAGQKAVLPSLQQQEREAISALATLVGQAPQNFSVQEQGLNAILLPTVSPGLPSELLVRRPDIRRAEATLAAAHANVQIAHAKLFPSIQLSAAGGVQSHALLWLFNSPAALLNIGAELATPVFDADRLKNQEQLAQSRKQELLQSYRATVLSAFAEVDVALSKIHSISEQTRLKKTELEQARLAFELSEIRYRAGAEDLMTVLDTQRTLSDVQNALGQLKLKRLQATVMLYKTLGGGWQDTTPAAGV